MKRTIFLMAMLALGSSLVFSQETINLKVISVSSEYLQDLLTQALTADGYKVAITTVNDTPGTSKMEADLVNGDLTVGIFGSTPERDAKFLMVKVGMTDGLVGKRILFIPKGSQAEYAGVKTLADFQKLGKTAGMGKAWADVGIWNTNKLKVLGIDGDWKVVFKMIESKTRGVDYLPLGASDFITYIPQAPFLDVEKNLLLVYKKDQVLYVSPTQPTLQPILEKALKKAQESGLIKKLVAKYYSQIFESPINMDKRIVIDLTLP